MPVRTGSKYNITLAVIGSIPYLHYDTTSIATSQSDASDKPKSCRFLDAKPKLNVIRAVVD